MTTIKTLSETQCFGGTQGRYTHSASSTHCEMTFSVFTPPKKNDTQHFPVLYWLSGLTCTDENFMQKAGAQRLAAELGIIIVAPDTSPRGEGVPDDKDASWDFGLGAGFYVDAKQTPWSRHYNMYSYVTQELPSLIEQHFPTNRKSSISGHSMGGHGAMVCALRNPSQYYSVSAFSPICHPTQCPWGVKAFTHYLGKDTALWQEYDSRLLIEESGLSIPLRIDQGLADNFLAEQLHTEALQKTIQEKKLNNLAEVFTHPNYDHSYYFIASFIESHLRFHYAALNAS